MRKNAEAPINCNTIEKVDYKDNNSALLPRVDRSALYDIEHSPKRSGY